MTDRFHMPAEISAKLPGVYRDFEGFADLALVIAACETKSGNYVWDDVCNGTEPPELKQAVRDITVNLVFEMFDQGGIDQINFDVLWATAYTVYEMLTVQRWLKLRDENFRTSTQQSG